MNHEEKRLYIARIINSCKTSAQLRAARNMVDTHGFIKDAIIDEVLSCRRAIIGNI